MVATVIGVVIINRLEIVLVLLWEVQAPWLRIRTNFTHFDDANERCSSFLLALKDIDEQAHDPDRRDCNESGKKREQSETTFFAGCHICLSKFEFGKVESK